MLYLPRIPKCALQPRFKVFELYVLLLKCRRSSVPNVLLVDLRSIVLSKVLHYFTINECLQTGR